MSSCFLKNHQMNKPRLILIFLLLIQPITANPIFAFHTNSIIAPFTKVTLENGLTVIIKETHFSPIAAIDIRVATGAKNDPPEMAGISHFFEHMLFKGTELRKVGEIAREIKSVGGYLNAQTSLDTTDYYVVVPSEYINLALDVESDVVMNSKFDPTEIERERNVILEELKMLQDMQTNATDLLIQQLFNMKSMAGTPETIKRINRDGFISYYRKYYVPNNMVLVVTGDVNTGQVLNQINRLFKTFKPGQVEPSPPTKMPKLQAISYVEIEKEVKQNYLYFGFPAPNLNSKENVYFELLKIILGKCRSSRLLVLTDHQFVNSIYADYYAFKDAGVFAIYAETLNTPVEVEDRVRGILKQIIEKGITDEELMKAKALLFAGFASATESNLMLANLMSNYEVNSSIEVAMNYETSIQTVTREELQQVAQKYLDPEHYVLTVIKPKEENEL
jgi:zinc protease